MVFIDGVIFMNNVSKIFLGIALACGFSITGQQAQAIPERNVSQFFGRAANIVTKKIGTVFNAFKNSTLASSSFFDKVVEFFRKKSSLLVIAIVLVWAEKNGFLSSDKAGNLKFIVGMFK